MNDEIPFEELLSWRLEQAKAEAPPAPDAASLLELARPWWEKWPEKFQSLVERMRRIQSLYDHTETEPARDLEEHLIPTLIVRGEEVLESSTRIMDFIVRDGSLGLRLQLCASLTPVENALEATFVSEITTRPLFFAGATVLADSDYSIQTELPAELARAWVHLKPANPMQFWLILRSVPNG